MVVGSIPTAGAYFFGSIGFSFLCPFSGSGALYFLNYADVSKWLRRWTWNPLGSARAGSNPAVSVLYLFVWFLWFMFLPSNAKIEDVCDKAPKNIENTWKKKSSPTRVWTAATGFKVQGANHYTIGEIIRILLFTQQRWKIWWLQVHTSTPCWFFDLS